MKDSWTPFRRFWRMTEKSFRIREFMRRIGSSKTAGQMLYKNKQSAVLQLTFWSFI